MKKKSILSLILLLTVLCGFNSCQDKPFDPIDDDPEYLLCNATGWYEIHRFQWLSLHTTHYILFQR